MCKTDLAPPPAFGRALRANRYIRVAICGGWRPTGNSELLLQLREPAPGVADWGRHTRARDVGRGRDAPAFVARYSVDYAAHQKKPSKYYVVRYMHSAVPDLGPSDPKSRNSLCILPENSLNVDGSQWRQAFCVK